MNLFSFQCVSLNVLWHSASSFSSVAVSLILGKTPKNFESVFWKEVISYLLNTLLGPRAGQFTFYSVFLILLLKFVI